MFEIFVANLQVPVKHAEVFTKTHKFANKSHICDKFSEIFFMTGLAIFLGL